MSGRALVFGEALIDQFPDRRVVAGAPLHVAVHLVALGWDAALVSRVGADGDGATILQAAQNHGVDVSLVERDDVLPTGTVTIALHENGGHSFTIHRPAAWDAISGPPELPRHDLLYFGTLALRDGRSRAALTRLEAESSAATVVDINLRPPDFDAEVVGYAVRAADVLKVSEDELPVVAGLLGRQANPRALHTEGPRWVCVTHGPDGASLTHADGGSWEVAAPPVEVVDTVGAGDAFCAGLIHGLYGIGDGAAALRIAQGVASAVVGRRGGFPD